MKKPNQCRCNSERRRPITSRVWGGGGKVRVANYTALTLATAARSHKSPKLQSPTRARVRGKLRRRQGKPVWGPCGAGAAAARTGPHMAPGARPRPAPRHGSARGDVRDAPGGCGAAGARRERSGDVSKYGSAAVQPGPDRAPPNYNPHHPPRGGRAIPRAAGPRSLPGAVVRPRPAPPHHVS